MVNIARAHRKQAEILTRLKGQTVFVHRNFGTAEMDSFETRGLKELEGGQVTFNFLKQEEMFPGMVLQGKGSRDYWKVDDTEDIIQDDLFICLEVRVHKINEEGASVRLNEQGKAIFTGNNYGVIQMGGQGNNQNVTVTHNINPDFTRAIEALADLVKSSSLSELEKEERLLEVERIGQLAQKEQTPEVKQLGTSKLQLLEAGLKAGDLAVKVAPYLPHLYAFFENMSK